MTEAEAYDTLPPGAQWSCSFGYAGSCNFKEYYRAPNGDRWLISNGNSYLDRAPFNWTATLVPYTARELQQMERDRELERVMRKRERERGAL